MKHKPGRFALLFAVSTLFLAGGTISAAQFQVQRPGKLSISRKIKKVFIDPAKINNTNDKLKITDEVVETLKKRLNQLGRFQVVVGPPQGFDPNRETVAVIQGDIISGGEVDRGQLTEKAVCRGGISGIIGTVTAAKTSDQGITMSRRGMPCKLPNLQSQLVEKGVTAGLSLLGLAEHPRVDEVIRVYKFKNYSLFAQVNLSFTQVGLERETLTIRADAASFSRHVINPGSFRNVRESGDNAPLIWLWFRITPIAPVIIEDIGVVRATNPGSYRGKWYDLMAPEARDIPQKEREKIISRLVNKTLTQFIRTISPYKTTIEAEVASGGNPRARKKLEEGSFNEAKKILRGATDSDDLYNLGLAFEAGATTLEDYEDAMRYYSQALEKNPGTKLYAQGIGRMEFQLRASKRLKKQTGN
ncbi:MAG: hypothetical protein GY866_24230 [Proteobacteria bacterium]|nr:hypothetical protein [Pseudomonadota bacterium]